MVNIHVINTTLCKQFNYTRKINVSIVVVIAQLYIINSKFNIIDYDSLIVGKYID